MTIVSTVEKQSIHQSDSKGILKALASQNEKLEKGFGKGGCIHLAPELNRVIILTELKYTYWRLYAFNYMRLLFQSKRFLKAIENSSQKKISRF